MKKITLLLLLFAMSLGYSQQVVLEDLEGTPTFAGFEGLAGASVVTDPLAGPNGQVLELISQSTGQPWQGAELIMQSNLMDLTTDITLSVDVYSTQTFTLLSKVEDKVGAPAAPKSSAEENYTTPGSWQTLTFTLNEVRDDSEGIANGQYSQIAFFPNWIDGGGWNTPPGDFTIYVDNITATPGASLGVNDFNLENVSVSPNPSRDTWNIKSNNFTINNVQVFDVLGKQVMTLEPRSNDVTIDASNLLKGLYFAKMTSDAGSNSIKLIKN